MPAKNGINMLDVKVRNRRAILELIYRSKKIPRKDIATQLGLTPAAITLITNDLIREGILIETEKKESNSRGRREVLLQINVKKFYVIGVSITRNHYELIAMDLNKEILYQNKFRTLDFHHDAKQILAAIMETIQSDILSSTVINKKKLLGIGVSTLGIVNVVGSSIAREADHVFYTLAGPEIAVATTKAYSAQLAVCYVLSIKLALAKSMITTEQAKELTAEVMSIPCKINKVLEDKERLQWFASKLAAQKDIFFIGRGIDYAITMEGSLKMKEISYIHSEAYAAGELKHGTISLIEEGTFVIGVLTQSSLYEKTLSNLVETKARGAYLMALTSFGNYAIEDSADFVVYVPKINELFAASLAVVPLQLLGYYVSCARGLDVDKPRNLAKSVTVE